MAALGGHLDGAQILDLFAGSGALGLEALSRGAAYTTFVETDARVLECLRANIELLGASEISAVVPASVFAFLSDLGARTFDIALADPPYGHGTARNIVQRFRREPFARILCVEHRRDEPIDPQSDANERRYGDTVISFIRPPDFEEE